MSSDKRQGTALAKALATFVLGSQVGTLIQILPALAVAIAGALLFESLGAGASVFEEAAGGFMSFQASRYFSNLDLFDLGVTHMTFRRSMTVAGKMYQGSRTSRRKGC